MNNESQPRTISLAEVVAATLVLFVWSAAFVAAAAVILMYFQGDTQLAAVEYPQPVVLAATETPTVTETPLPTSTPPPASPTRTKAAPTPTFTRVVPPSPTPVQSAGTTATDTAFAATATTVVGSAVGSVSAGEAASASDSAQGASVESLVIAKDTASLAQAHVAQERSLQSPTETAPTAALVPATRVFAPNSPSNPVAPPTRAFDPNVAPPPAGDPPTRLVIPTIGLDTPIVEVRWHLVEQSGRRSSEWDVADNVAGWHHGSALPGNPGNVVISGHHNIKGEVFRYLVNLEKGDAVYLYVEERAYPYAVVEKHILREKGMPDHVRSENARWIAKTTDERATLVTCWPYTDNTHRVIVVTKPLWRAHS